MITQKRYKPVVLLVLDGWGIAPPSPGNAIAQANTPNMDYLRSNDFYMTLQASGEAVGLSWAEEGNSEVGHMNLGAGRIVFQDLPRITNSIRSGEFFQNKAFLDAINHAKKNNSSLHLFGLASDGGVHSYIEHLYALMEMAKTSGLSKVYIHAVLDGRDVPQKSATKYIKELESRIKEIGVGEIATIGGRFWGMDRDNRWDRIEKAYKAMVSEEGPKSESPIEAIENSYKKEVYDEMIEPIVITKGGKPVAKVSKGDSMIDFSFRQDREREISHAFTSDDFEGFKRGPKIPDLLFVTMTMYDETLKNIEIAFPPETIKNTLPEVISSAGLKQFHIAETEKYAHVTYFFNGGSSKVFSGEDHIIIRSKGTADYSETPEMSVNEITDRVLKEILGDKYDFILINFANMDMVGHTGNLEASIKAAEYVDLCIGKLKKAIFDKDGAFIITADHGKGENVIDPKTGEPVKEHSENPVPFIIASKAIENSGKYRSYSSLNALMSPRGTLCDVAATILNFLDVEKPKEMICRNLFE